MFQVCEDGQLSGAGLQCGYHPARRVRLHIGLRRVGKLQVRENTTRKIRLSHLEVLQCGRLRDGPPETCVSLPYHLLSTLR